VTSKSEEGLCQGLNYTCSNLIRKLGTCLECLEAIGAEWAFVKGERLVHKENSTMSSERKILRVKN
jgi:hypothetical protein